MQLTGTSLLGADGRFGVVRLAQYKSSPRKTIYHAAINGRFRAPAFWQGPRPLGGDTTKASSSSRFRGICGACSLRKEKTTHG
jgi:hypothetical protein